MKKILLIILVLLFAVTCGPELPTVGGYEEKGITPWDGIEEKEPKFENSTYYIYEASELFWIANKSTNWSFKNEIIKLEKNINLNNHLFTPIATNNLHENTIETKGGRVFMGVFDGNNKKIMNLKIVNEQNNRDPAPVFFIGYVLNGSIINLTLDGGTIEGYCDAFGFVYSLGYDKDISGSPSYI